MSIQSRIEASAAGFTPVMRRIAEVIRQNPALVRDKADLRIRYPLPHLGRLDRPASASRSAFRAIPELRMTIATELGRETAQFGTTLTLGANSRSRTVSREMAARSRPSK